MPRVRVVVFIKFSLDKPKRPFTSKTVTTHTTDAKKVASVCFQLSARGKVVIQGAAGHFQTTHRLIQGFQSLARDLFPSYMVSL